MEWLLIRIVDAIADVLIFLLMARAILSWFVNGSNYNVYRIYNVLSRMTEPVVAPCRRFCSRWNTGGLDLSVLMAFLLIYVARTVIIRLLLILL